MPGQYVGGEPNAPVPPANPALRVALAFPDLYSVGMSHLGLRILHDLAAKRPGVAAERVFAPQPDFEAELRAAGLRLGTLETGTPLADCDLIGVSLGYELGATSLLTILDLGGVPLLARDRGAGTPLVLVGGQCAFNPEPWADFADAFFVGEAEEAWPKILDLLRDAGGRRADRTATLRALARLGGVYVPSLHRTAPGAGGFLVVEPSPDAPPLPVRRQIIADFASAPLPLAPIVPLVETVHDRVTLEILRGCPHGCRFCQSGMVSRPLRARSPETILAAARACIDATGYDEIGLLSLSTSDHPRFDDLVSLLDAEFAPRGVGLSLPSLRVNHALADIPRRFRSVRRSGLTLAPEAGTERLRAAINKPITDADLLAAAAEAYRQGWHTVKLYFMLGLPGETDEDAAAIADLANAVARLREKGPRRASAVHLSVSNFVPKAHTPFQWEAMCDAPTLEARHRIVASRLDRRRVETKTHNLATSLLEGALARGDRRLGAVLLRAWKAGARLDGWSDHFRPDLWEAAFREESLDPAAYRGEREEGAPLSWSHIDTGVSPAFLRRERGRSRSGGLTPDCTESCGGCGLEACPSRGPDAS